jgi:hypothetical protein
MEVITGLKEIWAQNSIMALTDMLNTAVAILKGDSLTSYEAAMEDNCTNPEDKSLMVTMTEQHIDNALLAVTNQIFPYCALETQKQWMSKSMQGNLTKWEQSSLSSRRAGLTITSCSFQMIQYFQNIPKKNYSTSWNSLCRHSGGKPLI